MKILSFLFLLISNISFAQNSTLYKSNRKLIMDPNYQIDDNSFKNSGIIDLILLLNIYNRIKYPEISRENNQEGTVIIKLSITQDSKDYQYNIVKSDHSIFNAPVLDFFKNLSDFTKNQISPKQGKLIIYIPIQFKILKNRFKENLQKNKAVTIEGKEVAPSVATSFPSIVTALFFWRFSLNLFLRILNCIGM